MGIADLDDLLLVIQDESEKWPGYLIGRLSVRDQRGIEPGEVVF
jgi:hypothetical protein